MPLISSITGSSSDHRAHWIGGAWTAPTSPDIDPVSNPADGSVIGGVPRGTAADAEAALTSAAAALPGWSGTPREDRLEAVQNWLRLIEADAEILSALISREVGTPIGLSRNVQVGLAIDIARASVDAVSRLDEERRGNSVIRRVPAGVVAAIIPWNVPLILTLQKVVPALLAGCTVVLKPSELTPLHAAHLARLAERCELPPGVLNIVFGDGPNVGSALASSPLTDLVSFTGSVRAGRSVSAAAAANLTRVHLELGGKSASLVLDDADLAQAVAASVGQALFNSGQACLQWSRLIVPRRLVREAEEIARTITATYVVGDPAAPDTDLGPLISADAKARVARACARGVAQGARAVLPPRDMDGLYFAPTVFSDVTMDMDLAQEEIFGPVVSIMTHDGDDDAVRLANSTRYGLHGSVWSSSDERATAVARRVRAGQLEINGAPFNPAAPFGGFKESGIGRECGAEGIDAFCELQALHYPVAGGRSVRAKA
ncbi:aldehyde dehydrogenase family protein [Streptomyces luomodiensis]|uniref:Aldehyde dehydrogenase family protein n=1 Tax=Streptomyces luomodiensis TaxID=3026192 RepID=A0ABY9UTW0_9ACTN|nr:aldehyde dehydrogenase family protein [Streptomyces sp. SCA4-21]WNE95309.1 aldehyde dehydrogenase family protein [Streptomyces sp. SCA4-21]